MTPEQIALVQNSFELIYPDFYDSFAEQFYARLFTIAPELRPLFPEDMAEQRSKLMTTMNIAVNGLRLPSTIIPILQKLGALHAGHAVEIAHYQIVGEALLWTIQQQLGDDYTPETGEAWTEAYRLISTTMIEGHAQLETPPFAR